MRRDRQFPDMMRNKPARRGLGGLAKIGKRKAENGGKTVAERKLFRTAAVGGYRKGDVEEYISQLESENGMLRVQLEKLKETLKEQQEYASSLQTEAEALRQELEEQKNGVTEAQENLRLVRGQAEEAAALAEEARKELKSALAKRESLQAELENASAERESLRAELESVSAERESLRAEMENASAKGESLQAELENVSAERKTLQLNVKNLRDEMDRQRQGREDVQKTLEEQEKRMLRLRRELEREKRQSVEQKKAYEKRLEHFRKSELQGAARESGIGVKAGLSSLMSKLFSAVPAGRTAGDRTKQIPLVTLDPSQKRIGGKKTEVTLIGAAGEEYSASETVTEGNGRALDQPQEKNAESAAENGPEDALREPDAELRTEAAAPCEEAGPEAVEKEEAAAEEAWEAPEADLSERLSWNPAYMRWKRERANTANGSGRFLNPFPGLRNGLQIC